MKVIFLDIDGVLNSSKTVDRNFDYPELDPQNLVVLQKIVNETDAVLVLTSSWKDDWINKDGTVSRQQEMIRYQLNRYGLDIYDCTADKIYNRGEGIIKWLNAHEVKSWCVLDDEIFPDYEHMQIVEKLVKTSYMDGLTDDCVNEAIMKLRGEALCREN